MKKKTVIAMLVMCMAFSAAACSPAGDKAATAEKTENAGEGSSDDASGEDSGSGEEKKASGVRLVSVDDVSKYVTIGEYKGLKLDNEVEPVTDDAVEWEIQNRLQEKPEEVKDGAVQNGDLVRINYTATIDGKEFEGGSEENYDITVGDSGMVPGFDDGLIGMKKGESRELTLTFPEDYYDESVIGKTAVYTVTLQKISRVPELTDQWVAANTDDKTVDEYRQSVRKSLEDDADRIAREGLYDRAWNQVLETSEVKEFPEEDLEKTVQEYKELNEKYITQSGMELSDFLEAQGMTQEDFDRECQEYGEAKLKQDLIVQGIVDAEGLSLEDKDAVALQQEMLQQYGVEDLSQMVELYGQVEVNESLALLRVEKFIVDNADVTELAGSGENAAVNEDAMTDQGAQDTQDAQGTTPSAVPETAGDEADTADTAAEEGVVEG